MIQAPVLENLEKEYLFLIALVVAELAIIASMTGGKPEPELYRMERENETNTPFDIRTISEDGPLYYRLKPNETMWIERGMRNTHLEPYVVQTNSIGFRDDDIEVKYPEKTYRVFVTGDSYTFGWGVNRSDMYTEALERKLESERKNAEVVNTGIPGYGMKDYWLTVKEIGSRVKPDIIVISMDYFDALSAKKSRMISRRARDKVPDNATNYQKKVWEISKDRRKEFFSDLELHNSSMKNYMENISSYAGERDIELIFYPYKSQRPEMQRFLRNYTSHHHGYYLPAPQELANQRKEYILKPGKDFHYNSAGQRLLAENLFNYITDTDKENSLLEQLM